MFVHDFLLAEREWCVICDCGVACSATCVLRKSVFVFVLIYRRCKKIERGVCCHLLLYNSVGVFYRGIQNGRRMIQCYSRLSRVCVFALEDVCNRQWGKRAASARKRYDINRNEVLILRQIGSSCVENSNRTPSKACWKETQGQVGADFPLGIIMDTINA